MNYQTSLGAWLGCTSPGEGRVEGRVEGSRHTYKDFSLAGEAFSASSSADMVKDFRNNISIQETMEGSINCGVNSMLPNTRPAQVWRLYEILWSWSLCGECERGTRCAESDCTSKRVRRLRRYLNQYMFNASSYRPELEPGQGPSLRSHEDLFELVELLKVESSSSRADLTSKAFQGRGEPLSATDQDCAVNLAAKVFAMVNCTATERNDLLENGLHQIAWQNDVSFCQFIEDAFPSIDHPSLSGDSWDVKSQLTARRLKKYAGIKFQPTNDLRRHLSLDSHKGTVEIFHYTAFLKEHLRLTKDSPTLSKAESLKRWVSAFLK